MQEKKKKKGNNSATVSDATAGGGVVQLEAALLSKHKPDTIKKIFAGQRPIILSGVGLLSEQSMCAAPPELSQSLSLARKDVGRGVG